MSVVLLGIELVTEVVDVGLGGVAAGHDVCGPSRLLRRRCNALAAWSVAGGMVVEH